MATPTAGPYSTTATIFDPTGTDANPIGSGWTTDITGAGTHSNWKRLSNVMAPSNEAGASQAYMAATNLGMDHEIWLQVPAKATTNGHYFDIWTMIADPNTGTRDGYFLEVTLAAGNDTWDLGRVLNAAGTFPLTTQQTQELTAGDWVAMSVRDDTSGNPIIKGWWWNGTTWVQVITYTDNTGSKITPAGYFGLEATLASAWRIGIIKGGVISAGGGGGGAAGIRDLVLLGCG